VGANQHPATGRPRSITIRLRCSDEREFRKRYLPWYASDGIFLPGALPAPLGTSLSVSIELGDGRRVLSGIARIEAHVKEPAGAQLRFLRVDFGSAPLAPTLAAVEPPSSGGKPQAHRRGTDLEKALFADLPAPEKVLTSKPLVVRTSTVKLRLRPTPVPVKP
jgi:hypothetical protein